MPTLVQEMDAPILDCFRDDPHLRVLKLLQELRVYDQWRHADPPAEIRQWVNGASPDELMTLTAAALLRLANMR